MTSQSGDVQVVTSVVWPLMLRSHMLQLHRALPLLHKDAISSSWLFAAQRS